MSKRRRNGGFPSPKVTNTNSNSLIYRLQKLEAAHNDYVRLTDRNLSVLQDRINAVNSDLGNLFDLFYALSITTKQKNVDLSDFNQFVTSKVGSSINEIDDILKFNILLDYLSTKFKHDERVFKSLVVQSFDKRNNLRSLNENEKPQSGDVAFMVMRIEVDEGVLLDFKDAFAYVVGSNKYEIDNEILQLGKGQQVRFTKSFSDKVYDATLKNKQASVQVGIVDWKRKESGQAAVASSMNVTDKKSAWKNKYIPKDIK